MHSTITSARPLATRGGRSPATAKTAAVLAVSLLATVPLLAQSAQSTVSSVPAGMRVLIWLEDKLSTEKHKVGKKFKAKTLEPIQAADGSLIPMGAEIRGRIGRLEPAGLTGRARLWLDFDDVKTRHGWLPLIASVVGVPGNHSVNPESKEGEIESRTGRRYICLLLHHDNTCIADHAIEVAGNLAGSGIADEFRARGAEFTGGDEHGRGGAVAAHADAFGAHRVVERTRVEREDAVNRLAVFHTRDGVAFVVVHVRAGNDEDGIGVAGGFANHRGDGAA